MKRTVVALSLALAATVLPATTPAEAACRPAPMRSARTLLYDDDELNTYAKVFVQVTRNCDRTYTASWGYYPNREWNSRLRCTSTTRAFVVNPSSVYGYNPPSTRFACRAYGARKTVRFRPSGTDRSFNAYAYADKAFAPDPRVTTPTRWAARR